MGTSIPWTTEDEQKALELYNTGLTYAQIGEQLGRTSNAIMNKVQRLNGIKPKTPRTQKEPKAEISSEELWKPDSHRYYIINGAKLKSIFKERGYTLASAGREINLGDGAFSNWCRLNYIPKYVGVLLDKVFDISVKDIEVVENQPTKVEAAPIEKTDYSEIINAIEKVAKKSETVLTEKDHANLYNTVYSAVYAAVKKAWSE